MDQADPWRLLGKQRRIVLEALSTNMTMSICNQIKVKPFAWAAMALLLTCSAACTRAEPERAKQQAEAKARQETAMRMWKERCEAKAGVKIYRTVDDVDGIFLMKIRTFTNYGDQFAMNDPYGHDAYGDIYILNFLKGFYHQRTDQPKVPGSPLREGFKYVEAIDPKDGVRYRYTGRIDQPWLRDKRYGEWVRDFVLDKSPATGSPPRYGVTYDDISTHEEREYWIAGSSLRVIDLKTNEVIAERIGYMVDWAQGSLAGARSPWLFAADHACPGFQWNPNVPVRHASGEQESQTLIFVEQVLKPSK